MAKYIMGFDIGGTKCSVVLADIATGPQPVDKITFLTNAGQGFPQAKNRLLQAGRQILEKNGLSQGQVLAIGISCGGPLDSKKGRIYSPPHLPGWEDIPIRDILSNEFGAPAFLQNDANAGALAEWMLGAGKGTQDMVFITMGTGFGAGIISGGKLVEGASGLAGEIGHIRLENDGPVGYGKTGSVEGFCSGAGIEMAAKKYTKGLLKQGHIPAWLGEGKSIEDITPKEMAYFAQQGDPNAVELFRQIGYKLGKTLAVLVDLLNPQRIVIGSIFQRCENLLRSAMEQAMQQEALPHNLKDCTVVAAQTGEEIGQYASIIAACYPLGIKIPEETVKMKPGCQLHYDRLFLRYPVLKGLELPLLEAFHSLRRCFLNGGKLLTCGNGGSAMDAEHIVGELMKGFYLPRRLSFEDSARYGKISKGLQYALPSIALTQHTALNTAFANDVDPEMVFAQQVFGYGKQGDVLLAISTSGNAKNVANAAETAQKKGMQVIGLTGQPGGRLAQLSMVHLAVPSRITAEIQELHLPVYHALCAMLEEEFFGNSNAEGHSR